MIKITGKTLVVILIILSSCVISRRKELVKLLARVETDPETYCFTIKTKITDILSIKAKIDNQVNYQDFMFDTGSPLTYKFKTIDSFNITAKKLFRFGSYKFDYGSGSVTLSNVKFNNTGFLVTDHILGYYKNVVGIIGSSILQKSICELNFADSTIKISNDLKNFTNIQSAYSSAFKPYEGQGTPVIKVLIGKDTLTAFIDTGFSDVLLINGKVKIPSETAVKRESHIASFYQVNRIGILGMDIDSLVIWQDAKYYGRNLVGLEFLKKFIVTIDWINHHIYLKPIGEIHFKPIYTYGLTCRVQNKQLHIINLYKGSELEKAGIKTGDIITKINGSTDFSATIISNINSIKLINEPIQIEIKNKSTFTLKKYKLFD